MQTIDRKKTVATSTKLLPEQTRRGKYKTPPPLFMSENNLWQLRAESVRGAVKIFQPAHRAVKYWHAVALEAVRGIVLRGSLSALSTNTTISTTAYYNKSPGWKSLLHELCLFFLSLTFGVLGALSHIGYDYRQRFLEHHPHPEGYKTVHMVWMLTIVFQSWLHCKRITR